jgi:lipase chaperone LimK
MQIISYLRQGGYVAAALASAGLIWYWQAGTQADTGAVPGAAAPAWNGAVGPGTLGGAPRNAALDVDTDDLPPADAFTLSGAGQLVANRQLRATFDYFLIRSDGADLAARAAQLRGYLAQRLPAAAAAQAEALLTPYVAYVRTQDELLARQQFALAPGALPDAQQTERLAVWQAQRARLRQASFAPGLRQAWFGDEDDALADAVAELRNRYASGSGAEPDGSAQAGEADSNALRQQRLHGATEQAARDAELAELARDATVSYESAAAQERLWRVRYARYRMAVSELQGAASGPGEARRRKLEALRAELFPTAAERLRARASGIE